MGDLEAQAMTKSEVFQRLFDHGSSESGGSQVLEYRILRRKGEDFMLLPLDNGLAVKALTLYAPQNLVARVAIALLRFALRLGLPVPLKNVELEIKSSSPLIQFFTEALNLTGLGATDFAIIAGNPKDAARRYVFLLFDTLHRPALVVKVGLGERGAETVRNEFQFLADCATEDGLIPRPQGNREGEEFAAFALSYQPGCAPSAYREMEIFECLGKWFVEGRNVRLSELPLWSRLAERCGEIEGFERLAAVVKDVVVVPVIFHGDFAPWNIKLRPDDGAWVVLDWERGEMEGMPGWDWFHYIVQTGVLVENLDEKMLRAKLVHVLESSGFSKYAERAGIGSIKLEMALLYLLHSIYLLDQAVGRDRLLSLYLHLEEELKYGVDRNRKDYSSFWAARDLGASWLKGHLLQRPGAWLALAGYRNRAPAETFNVAAILIAAFGSLTVLSWGLGAIASGLWLIPVLLVSGIFATAERMLAAVTGTTSRLGLVVDRVAAVGVFVTVIGILAWGAGTGQARWLSDFWKPFALGAAVVAGLGLYGVRLLRDVKGRSIAPLRRPVNGVFGSLLSLIKWSVDGVLRILLISIAWMCGVFWDFLFFYGVLMAISAVGEWLDLAASLRRQPAARGRVAKFFVSSRRSLERTYRRLLFLKVFFTRKRSKTSKVGRRWVRSGIQKTQMPETVDVVYLWKDESDSEWVERREIFLELLGKGRGYNRINMGSRATKKSLERLKYSMRSVDRHFKSLGKIYLVSDGQKPSWLDGDDARVVLVDINDIFDDPTYLPSYNSQAIESHFFNIPGLSEFFVYFNDDFFLNAPVTAGDFFTSDGFLRVRLGRSVSARGSTTVDEEGDTSAQKNANLVLDRRFKKESRLTVMHRPYPHRKSFMMRAAEEFPEEFHLTRRSHFRSIEMFAIHSYLIPYWAYYNGEAELISPELFSKDMFYWTNDSKHNHRVLERILETNPPSFCIQADLSVQLTEESVSAYRAAMDSVFPEKSSFEI